MSNVHNAVRLILEGLTDPDRLSYHDCPACDGRQKLMVGPASEGGYFYSCLRASCDCRGVVRNGGLGGAQLPYGGVRLGKGRTTFPQLDRLHDVRPLTSQQTHELGELYRLDYSGIDELCAGYWYSMNRWVFPMWDTVHGERGYVLRQREADSRYPKALVRPYESTGAMCSWYGHDLLYDDSGAPIVVVEDQPSAARLGEYRPAVALLGTTMSHEVEVELLSTGREIVIALDNDAVEKGRDLARRIGARFWPLFEDVKDMHDETFSTLLRRLH